MNGSIIINANCESMNFIQPLSRLEQLRDQPNSPMHQDLLIYRTIIRSTHYWPTSLNVEGSSLNDHSRN